MTKEKLITCFQDTLQMSQEGKLRENTINAINSNRVYKEAFVSENKVRNTFGEVGVYSGTTFDVAKKYCQYGKVAVLNFANPEFPGGGVTNGAMAQEECLCRSSNLYACISNKNVFKEYYDYHRELKNSFYTDRLIYTTGVTVFKNDDLVPQLMLEEDWFDVDVITCAAPYVAKRKYTNTAALLSLFKKRIKNIFEAARDNEVDVIVLGAFGCGAFKNPPLIVAEAFKQVIEEENYLAEFKHIVFAIKPTGDNCPNLTTFTQYFGYKVDEEDCTLLVPQAKWRFTRKSSFFRNSIAINEQRFFHWQEKNRYYGKQFSIIGDSISTLDGYNPMGYNVFYVGENSIKADVTQVENTWWDNVISYFGGELLINNSWSGSRVTKLRNSETLFPSASSDERTSSLHINDISPNVIIVYMGTNDWAFGAKLENETGMLDDESFLYAYDNMLRKLKSNYPKSEIWCCTLSETCISKRQDFIFPHSHAGTHIEEYNAIIRKVVQKNECNLIDLYEYRMPYDTVDGIHPTSAGMNTIAKMVISSMIQAEDESFLECEIGRHSYLLAEELTGVTKYICAKCGKIWWHSVLPTKECLENEHEYEMVGQTGDYDFYMCVKCGKRKTECVSALLMEQEKMDLIADESEYVIPKNEDEYVMLDSDITTMLYGNTLKLMFEESGRVVQIQKNVINVGRATESDLLLTDKTIARRQATFFFENNSWFLRDNNSTNGTWLNAVRMIPGKKYQLKENDVINFSMSEKVVFYKREKVELSESEKAVVILEAAIKSFVKSNHKDDLAFQLILSAIIEAPLYFPVEIDIVAMLGGVNVEELSPGDELQLQEDVRMKVRTVLINDVEFVAAFTSTKEVHKGADTSIIRYYPQDYISMLLKMDKPIIINPFSEYKLFFPQDLLGELLGKFEKNSYKNEPVKNIENVQKDKYIGTTIAYKYSVIKLLGEGGFFKTYLVEDRRFKKKWAMKICDKKHKNYNVYVKDAILQEPYMMKKLSHPTIPVVVDIWEDNDSIFIIREYVEGQSLKQIVNDFGAQPEEMVIEWAKELCGMLSYLHNQTPPHIYRDMKPANVILMKNQHLKVIDFGIVRLYDESKREDTCCLGTKGYAAPEQYGGYGQTNARTDIFGLGMTMHHLVTGNDPTQPPYEIKPIREMNPSLSKGLEYIISKCIEPNPDNRYQSAMELLDDLNNYRNLPKSKGLLEKLFGKKK